jgi:hypothetical protein
MLYREIMAVYSEIHTNTLCGQNVELLNVNPYPANVENRVS